MNDWQQDVADSRAVIRTQPDGSGPPAWIYGSEGWEFESPRVRQCDESGLVRQMSRVIGYVLAIGRGVFVGLRQ